MGTCSRFPGSEKLSCYLQFGSSAEWESVTRETVAGIGILLHGISLVILGFRFVILWSLGFRCVILAEHILGFRFVILWSLGFRCVILAEL